MAIADILWSCPGCHAFGSIQPARRGAERCTGCGATFHRGPGATIVAEFPGGHRISRSAAEWMDRLPLEMSPSESGVIAEARASVRRVIGFDAVHRGAEFLNRIERLGPATDVTITLYTDRIRIAPGQGEPLESALQDVAALGSSSGTLQLRLRGTGLLAIRFHNASIRWWEEQLRLRLRNAYARAGRGQIVEFQPQIVAR